jgi:hypothetical protein
MAPILRKRNTKVDNDRLKSYLDATKHESVLLGPVDQYLQLLPNDRDATVIHPSEMSSKDWCHRATWHRISGHPLMKPPPAVALKPSLIFAEGHQIHRKWQGWLRGMGILWGRWKCLACHESVEMFSNDLRQIGCTGMCNGEHLWEYMEVPLEYPSHRMAGHADGVVRVGNEVVLVEFKSVGPGTMRLLGLLDEDENDGVSSERFSKISMPARSHLIQTQIYLRLMEAARSTPLERAVVIYEHKADQQVREFPIVRNDSFTDPLFDAALDIAWAMDRGREVKCPFGGCSKCKSYEEG